MAAPNECPMYEYWIDRARDFLKVATENQQARCLKSNKVAVPSVVRLPERASYLRDPSAQRMQI